jgi:hypothetical protein
LDAKGLSRFEKDWWNVFLRRFLKVIQDCPLTCEAKDAGLQHVDKIQIIAVSESRVEADRDTAPPINWALFFKTVHKFTLDGNLSPHAERETI